MTPAKEKSGSVPVPKAVLFGLIASLILLIAGALVTIFAGLPEKVAEAQSKADVTRASFESFRDETRTSLRRIESDIAEIRKDVKELRK